MRRVIIESPYAGSSEAEIDRNVAYARACMADCIRRGEAPLASHLLYTQPGVLRDNDVDERNLGIACGLEWAKCAEATVVYIDLGATEGMREGVRDAQRCGRSVVLRLLEWKPERSDE